MLDSAARKRGPAPQDLTGQRFHRLVALRYLGRENHSSMWECRCDCGTSVRAQAGALKNGGRKSCGCFRRERMTTLTLKHGEKGSKLYGRWVGMKDRCHNPENKFFHRYGGRGITVCERWRDDYSAFASDMGIPMPGQTLDRIDNSKGYEPGNCRWATASEQARNRFTNRVVLFRGEPIPLCVAVELAGVKYGTVRARLARGLSVDAALS